MNDYDDNVYEEYGMNDECKELFDSIIDNFNYLSDKYGFQVADEVLHRINGTEELLF